MSKMSKKIIFIGMLALQNLFCTNDSAEKIAEKANEMQGEEFIVNKYKVPIRKSYIEEGSLVLDDEVFQKFLPADQRIIRHKKNRSNNSIFSIIACCCFKRR